MSVIVDTSIWSLALRREGGKGDAFVKELEELIVEMRVQLMGPIRQELLSGIRSEKQYRILRSHLRAFRDLPLETSDFELASEFFNTARKNGIQGSHTDFLICAVSSRSRMPVFTTDKDFVKFQSVLSVSLHKIRA